MPPPPQNRLFHVAAASLVAQLTDWYAVPPVGVLQPAELPVVAPVVAAPVPFWIDPVPLGAIEPLPAVLSAGRFKERLRIEGLMMEKTSAGESTSARPKSACSMRSRPSPFLLTLSCVAYWRPP